ncbi:MAG TPA: hypothetical protein VK837_04450 [Longimicrobiales bacterium]|nr:hypothetical protein [Longimicrobiales bacterium]
MLLEALARDPARAPVADADRAMLGYAMKVNDAPWDVTHDDARALRDHGFDDRAIHDICAIAAYFAFVNRIADGLGVELEARFEAESAPD